MGFTIRYARNQNLAIDLDYYILMLQLMWLNIFSLKFEV